MLTRRRTVLVGVRMCTGLAAPSRIGPTVTPCAGHDLERVEGDVGGVQVGHHQQVGLGRQPRVREHPVEDALGERGVRLHLALGLELGRPRLDQRQGFAHLARRGRVGGAEAGVREQGHPRLEPEAADLLRRQERHVGELLGRGVGVDVGVADEHGLLRQHQEVHGREIVDALAQADRLGDVLQVAGVGAEGAAQHAVGPALADQHGADQRAVAAHLGGGELALEPAPLAELVVGLGRRADQRLVVEARDLVVAPVLEPQAEVAHLVADHLGPADQDRPRQALVDRDLGRAQHPVVLALGVDDALGRLVGGGREHRLHHRARGVDVALQAARGRP